MILASQPQKVVSIKKKTKAQFFEHVEVGDILQFQMTIKHAGSASGGGVYASTIHIQNLTKDISTHRSQSELVNILKRCFELEERPSA